jgi:hypothetical protein
VNLMTPVPGPILADLARKALAAGEAAHDLPVALSSRQREPGGQLARLACWWRRRGQ